ncbi:MAG: tetratricopeptide repeat protein [Acidobacteria bacterium]|nr:tetratricopeptide repeat protein [Acidobacteriota bacterium]
MAQGGVGSTRGLPGDGIHIIKGRVYFPGEPKEGKRLRVVLKSPATTDQTTVTDEDGTFIFNRLRAENYTVIVEGWKEFDQAVEHVILERQSPSASNVNLAIHLKLKGTAEALSKIPKAARDLYAKGAEAAAKGDSKKAVEHLSGAVAAYPEFPQALSELGVQYLKLGVADKAAESLQATLKIAPGDLGARLNYGFALLSQKKFDEAETQLREVLKKNDAIPTAHMYLGIALMNQKKLDDAEAELLRANNSKSNEVVTAHRYLGGIYWGKRDYKRAADELELYLKLAPKAPDAERTRAAIKDLRSKQ